MTQELMVRPMPGVGEREIIDAQRSFPKLPQALSRLIFFADKHPAFRSVVQCLGGASDEREARKAQEHLFAWFCQAWGIYGEQRESLREDCVTKRRPVGFAILLPALNVNRWLAAAVKDIAEYSRRRTLFLDSFPAIEASYKAQAEVNRHKLKARKGDKEGMAHNFEIGLNWLRVVKTLRETEIKGGNALTADQIERCILEGRDLDTEAMQRFLGKDAGEKRVAELNGASEGGEIVRDKLRDDRGYGSAEDRFRRYQELHVAKNESMRQTCKMLAFEEAKNLHGPLRDREIDLEALRLREESIRNDVSAILKYRRKAGIPILA